MAMFKNKALYVQMVSPAKPMPNQMAATQSEEITEIPPWVDQSIKEYGLFVLKGVLVLMAAQAALNTVSQILINNTKPDND